MYNSLLHTVDTNHHLGLFFIMLFINSNNSFIFIFDDEPMYPAVDIVYFCGCEKFCRIIRGFSSPLMPQFCFFTNPSNVKWDLSLKMILRKKQWNVFTTNWWKFALIIIYCFQFSCKANSYLKHAIECIYECLLNENFQYRVHFLLYQTFFDSLQNLFAPFWTNIHTKKYCNIKFKWLECIVL